LTAFSLTADAVQGVGAFYKGFIPNFGRLGSWNVIMFLTLEQVMYCMQCIFFQLVLLCDAYALHSLSAHLC